MIPVDHASGTIPAPFTGRVTSTQAKLCFMAFCDPGVWSLIPKPHSTFNWWSQDTECSKKVFLLMLHLCGAHAFNIFIWKREERLPWLAGYNCTMTSSSFLGGKQHAATLLGQCIFLQDDPLRWSWERKIHSKRLELLSQTALKISPPHQFLLQESWDQNTPKLMHKHQSVCWKSPPLASNTQMESDVICIPIQAYLGCGKLNPSLVKKEGGKSSLLVTHPT